MAQPVAAAQTPKLGLLHQLHYRWRQVGVPSPCTATQQTPQQTCSCSFVHRHAVSQSVSQLGVQYSAVYRKRETLTGDATIRYFDYLDGFDHFDGLLANLFTGRSLLRCNE